MSGNITNNNVSVRIGSVLDGQNINIFQTLKGDTLSVIGTSYKGKAFVPQNVSDVENVTLGDETFSVFNNIENIIGTERKNRYRNLNDSYSYLSDNQSFDFIKTWLDGEGSQATFTRILGLGSGIKSSEENYIGAGFNLSNRISYGSIDGLTKSENSQSIAGGVRGNISFIASSKTSRLPDYIEDLGLNSEDTNYFFDTVIFSADGILPSIITAENPTDHEAQNTASSYINQIKESTNTNCYLELLGLDSSEGSLRKIISVSNSMNIEKINQYAPQIISKENFWPDRFLERGHFVYSKFPSSNQLQLDNDDEGNFKIITSRPYDLLGNNNLPDFNSFESHYQTAKTPWITSQPINRSGIENNRENIQEKVVDLFRFHSLDDGEVGNRFRIKINIKSRGSHVENIYSSFDIYIFEYEARNNTFIPIDTINNVNLNPESNRYISRVFGDENTHYDITSKKIITKVKYERKNKFLRVEVHPDVEDKKISPDTIPSGFRAYPHIRLNQSSFPDYNIENFYQMPLLYATNYFEDNIISTGNINNNWGVCFLPTKFEQDKIVPLISRNAAQDNYISPHYYYTKYFLCNLKSELKNIWVQDDSYLNSFFHLEKIYYEDLLENITNDNLFYSRKGNTSNNRIYINLDDDDYWDANDNLIDSIEDKLSFDFFTYGGFDGFDIRDFDKRFATNAGLVRETNGEDSTIILSENPLFKAYSTGIDIATNDLLGDDILCIPGISNLQLAEKCISICEDKKNIIYISDINTFNTVIIDNYLSIDNTVANYQLDQENDIININSDIAPNTSALKYSIDQNFDRIISISDSTLSRFFIPVIGTLSGTKESTTKRFDPSIAILQKLSTFNPENISGNINLINGYSLRLLDERLNENLQTWDLDTLLFRSLKINSIYNPKTNNPISILSQNTRHDVRDTFFSTLKNMRILNLIKKEIKFNLFTKYSITLKGPVLFSQNSNILNLKKIIEIQLRSLLNSFKERGLINDFYIKLPDETDERELLDFQNYIVRGTIILQFNNESNNNIISLKLDDILSELSLISEQSSIEIIQPRL